MCVPPNVAEQRFGKHVPTATNSDLVLSILSVLYQMFSMYWNESRWLILKMWEAWTWRRTSLRPFKWLICRYSIRYLMSTRSALKSLDLTEHLYTIPAICTLDKRQSILIRDKLILSWERMLHKDHDPKGSIGKQKRISGREPQGVWRQDEMIVGKPPVVK
jgi:hypothetical protein